ncbi:MAG: hypothetical protein IJF43_07645 [Firmicutes bacterium]|nr:hypothetical protein [Bacillota bacterium]
MNDYHAYKNTSGGSGGGFGGGDGFGCGWVVIMIVALMLIFFLFNGASWDAIEGLLTWGLIAFFFAKSLFR